MNSDIPLVGKRSVVLFNFNRPQKTRQVLKAIEEYRPRTLFLVLDGPRGAEDEELVKATRNLLESFQGADRIFYIFSPTNLGLRRRFESALDLVFEQEDSALILEDDCVPSPSFFRYSSELLDRYKDDPNIGLISGSNFAPGRNLRSYFFDNNAYIWGWAVWRRTWLEYRKWSGQKLGNELDLSSVSKTYSHWLEKYMVQRLYRKFPSLNTWDVPFTFYLRTAKKLNITPNTNLVMNTGRDASGTNYDSDSDWEPSFPSTEMNFPLTHPDAITIDQSSIRKMWKKRMIHIFRYVVSSPAQAWRMFLRILKLNR